MDKLIQTQFCNIIYGEFRGNTNEELFRCPRTDEKCLESYINRERRLVGFEDDDTEDLRNVEGKELKDYWRMYFRGGWAGRWMAFENRGIDDLDCIGVDNIIDWFVKEFPNGCDWKMKEYFSKHFKSHSDGNRYLIRPLKSNIYKVMVDTTYGNGDYPVRIYVYKDKEEQ